ncbi:MAG: hypothetical protein V1695_04295 [Candidatus Uhrbacteria bacterium]
MQHLLISDQVIKEQFDQRGQAFAPEGADHFRRHAGMRHDLDQFRQLLAQDPPSTRQELRRWVEQLRDLTGNAVFNSPFWNLRKTLFAQVDRLLS